MKRDDWSMIIILSAGVLFIAWLGFELYKKEQQPDLVINNVPYKIKTNCIKDTTYSEYSWHFGYDPLYGKFKWHWGWNTKNECLEYKSDTIKMKK